MGLQSTDYSIYGENYIILTLTVFDWSTRVTDRQTDRRTGDSIYDVARWKLTRHNHTIASVNLDIQVYTSVQPTADLVAQHDSAAGGEIMPSER